MTVTPINPVLKQVLEFGPTVFYLILYFWIKDEVYVLGGVEYSGLIMATLLFVPVMVVAMGILWAKTGSLSRIQMFTAFMVIFFGALTWYFANDTFIKIKTTIINGSFAVILGVGLLRGQSYLEWIMGEFIPMEHRGWMLFTKRLALLYLGLAIANEVIWRTMSESAWFYIEGVGFPVIMMGFMFWQIFLLQEHLIEEDAPKAPDATPGDE